MPEYIYGLVERRYYDNDVVRAEVRLRGHRVSERAQRFIGLISSLQGSDPQVVNHTVEQGTKLYEVNIYSVLPRGATPVLRHYIPNLHMPTNGRDVEVWSTLLCSEKMVKEARLRLEKTADEACRSDRVGSVEFADESMITSETMSLYD